MPESRDPESVLTVPAADAEAMISMLKRHLPGERTCPRCEYTAPVGQWGYRTRAIPESDRVIVYACCPSCESIVRLRRGPVDAAEDG